MKHLVALLIVLTCSLAAWAGDVEIPLESTTNSSGLTENVQKEERSLSFAPKASHDGNRVYIYCIPIPATPVKCEVSGEVSPVDENCADCGASNAHRTSNEPTV